MIYYSRKNASNCPCCTRLDCRPTIATLLFGERKRILKMQLGRIFIHLLQKGSLAAGGVPHIWPHMPPVCCVCPLMYSSMAPSQLLPLPPPHLIFPLLQPCYPDEGRDQEGRVHPDHHPLLPTRPSAFAPERLEPNLSLSSNFLHRP